MLQITFNLVLLTQYTAQYNSKPNTCIAVIGVTSSLGGSQVFTEEVWWVLDTNKFWAGAGLNVYIFVLNL